MILRREDLRLEDLREAGLREVVLRVARLRVECDFLRAMGLEVGYRRLDVDKLPDYSTNDLVPDGLSGTFVPYLGQVSSSFFVPNVIRSRRSMARRNSTTNAV